VTTSSTDDRRARKTVLAEQVGLIAIVAVEFDDREKCTRRVFGNWLYQGPAGGVRAARRDVSHERLELAEAARIALILDCMIEHAIGSFVRLTNLQLPSEEVVDEAR